MIEREVLMMAAGGIASSVSETHAAAVWSKTCAALKRELGEATFGSWLGQAALRERGEELCLVAATGVARDWIRRHAWRRIGELWAMNDPMGRNLDLKSRMEFDALAAAHRAYQPNRIDGVRLEFADGWGMIRASVTEPLFTLRFEARTTERLREIAALLAATLAIPRNHRT